MGGTIGLPERGCRHLRLGRCLNHFWKVMKTQGKPGLEGYYCALWRQKLIRIEAYWAAREKADRLGLSPARREEALTQAEALAQARAASGPACPQALAQGAACPYYYLQTCLKLYPRCQGRCDDYLPGG